MKSMQDKAAKAKEKLLTIEHDTEEGLRTHLKPAIPIEVKNATESGKTQKTANRSNSRGKKEALKTVKQKKLTKKHIVKKRMENILREDQTGTH